VIEVGDCLDTMQAMEPASVDAVVCDPPYGLSFMGKEWDHGVPGVQFWEAALRVAKPGAYLLAFGGTRTWHRLACAVEDAGWDIRDTLCWLYGSGFPKGKRCLKPAWEPVIMARKKGPGDLQVDACRIGTDGGTRREGKADRPNAAGWENMRGHSIAVLNSGRWPANVILDEEAGVLLDGEVGTLTSGARLGGDSYKLGRFAGQVGARGFKVGGACDASSGGPSRFYYCAKASRSEREAGLEGMPRRTGGTMDGGHVVSEGRSAPKTGRVEVANPHPTVKPIALMRWLCRLVTPPGGLILDPFAGSGTTGCAAALEGFRFVGCEKVPKYATIAEARIAYHGVQPRLMEVAR